MFYFTTTQNYNFLGLNSLLQISMNAHSEMVVVEVVMVVDLVTRSVPIHLEVSCVCAWTDIPWKWMDTHAEKVADQSNSIYSTP